MTDLEAVYKELDSISGLIDIESNNKDLYDEFKNVFYLHPIEDFEY